LRGVQAAACGRAQEEKSPAGLNRVLRWTGRRRGRQRPFAQASATRTSPLLRDESKLGKQDWD
jgi:hypothetical protein